MTIRQVYSGTIVKQTSILKTQYTEGSHESQVAKEKSTSKVDVSGFLEDFLESSQSSQHSEYNNQINDWLYQSLIKKKVQSKEVAHYIVEQLIIEIDTKINSQINEILHHPRIKQLEASWRGLKYLVDTEADYDEDLTVKVKVLNASWAEVGKDLTRAIEFDQSQVFQRIYSDEFDTPGGEPFGVVLGDYQISHRNHQGSVINDLDTLNEISHVATAALCPFITGVDSSLFGLNSFREFGYSLDFENVFNQKEYIKWSSLRESESTRFIGLTLPHTLMRKPYKADGTRPESFVFNETCKDGDKDYVWGNSCYSFGGILIRAFANTGWFADIRGGVHEYGEGGVVKDLQYANFDVDPHSVAARPATNVQIDDFLERELSDLGFIPLCSYHSAATSTFYSNSSLHKPPHYPSEIASTNAKLSSMIQYMLCVSRFGHYIKVIGRDKIGTVISAQDCQRVFQNWLNQYTTASEGSSQVLKARYPLAESKVEIREQPGKIGCFTCVVYLKPHFQLDQLVSSIKLVTELAVGNIKAAV
ncbi:MAG: type VI secretion system contractile sheath large subunit [Cellvibrionaceae bacterium]